MAHAQRRKCSHATASGGPCKAWAVHGSDPPACAAHGGSGARRPGPGAMDALTPEPAGSPDILEVIADLAVKQGCLSRYIDECLSSGQATVQDITRLLALHGQNAARLGRLLRDKQALSPAEQDLRDSIIYQALDALAEEWGMDL